MSKVQFKNIIFDLGGVLLDLQLAKTYQAFSELSGVLLSEVASILGESALFLEYEKGMLTDAQFRSGAKRLLSLTCSDEAFDGAWNKMLGDLPLRRIELLASLQQRYRTFLLSNTNQIHKNYFSETVRKNSQGIELDNFFTKAYYSHQLKMRKPDADVFQFVLSQNALVAEETIFLDDNVANLQGAAAVGIQTFHVTHPDLIFTLFE